MTKAHAIVGLVSFVHRSEVFANLTEVTKGVLRLVGRGELTALLAEEPRDQRPSRALQKRLSPAEIDQLVADYQADEGSIYRLADKYGVHRNTVAGHLRGNGLRLGHQPLSESEIRRAQELQAGGLSLNAIGRRLERDPKTVKKCLAD